MRLTDQVHFELEAHLREGDLAIDATAGNGLDTYFLAQNVGESGQVLAIDIQESAIHSTRSKLIDKNMIKRTNLILGDHAAVLNELIKEYSRVASAVVFNLGYLPGSDKFVQTNSVQTLKALNAASQLLRPGGLLSVTAYQAHLGGEAETQAVRNWMALKGAKNWTIVNYHPNAAYLPPILWIAKKP